MNVIYIDIFSITEKINSPIVKTKNINASHCFQ